MHYIKMTMQAQEPHFPSSFSKTKTKKVLCGDHAIFGTLALSPEPIAKVCTNLSPSILVPKAFFACFSK